MSAFHPILSDCLCDLCTVHPSLYPTPQSLYHSTLPLLSYLLLIGLSQLLQIKCGAKFQWKLKYYFTDYFLFFVIDQLWPICLQFGDKGFVTWLFCIRVTFNCHRINRMLCLMCSLKLLTGKYYHVVIGGRVNMLVATNWLQPKI